jgi:hypothetical protein
MRILILNTDYSSFLQTFYRENPGLADAPYDAQLAARNATLFGAVDFYSRNFRRHGHDAAEIHVNNCWIQYAWAREHGLAVPPPPPPSEAGASEAPPLTHRLKTALRPVLRPLIRPFRPHRLPAWEGQVLAAQVAHFRPDVILNQEISYIDNRTLRPFRKAGIAILGQLASPLGERAEYDAYDLVISSLPNLVAHFRSHGVTAELNRLAFEPSVLQALGPQPPRDIALSFVGSLSQAHPRRTRMLEYIARHAPLKIWGTGIEHLAADSPLRACHHGEAWGRDMYEILRRSRITLNRHIDMAKDWANNMRLYEATGMGALLLTDAKRNLQDIFVPGREVAAYASDEDCIAQIGRYLADEPARAGIAAAGQKRAVEVETYYNRTAEILELIRRHGLVRR